MDDFSGFADGPKRLNTHLNNFIKEFSRPPPAREPFSIEKRYLFGASVPNSTQHPVLVPPRLQMCTWTNDIPVPAESTLNKFCLHSETHARWHTLLV